MTVFLLNDQYTEAKVPGGMRVLDWLRGRHDLRGTKEGCREGDCGACTVLLGTPGETGVSYQAVCSCMLPMAELGGKHLVTIEGISRGDGLTPFQEAFYLHGASQCGFCTPGMIMSLTGFLLASGELTLEKAVESLDGNICRCTGYAAVLRAVSSVVKALPGNHGDRLESLIRDGHVPPYFREVPEILAGMEATDVPVPCGERIAGGTDVYVNPEPGLEGGEPELLHLPGSIETSEGRVLVGAGVTVKALRDSRLISELFPGIEGFLKRVSSTQIRSRATLGGNIMNGSPIGDLAVLFMALDSTVHSEGGESIPLRQLYTGYKTFSLKEGELIHHLTFPLPPAGAVLSALKVARREHLDIASVNSAAFIVRSGGRITSASISAGGVAPYPLFLAGTSSLLAGSVLDEELIRRAETAAAEEISPISDVRGSREYKTKLLKAQIRAHLTGNGEE